MKLIPLTEAKTHLNHYGRLCREESVIVTVNGIPTFQLVPVEEDSLIDQLIEHNPRFAALLEARQIAKKAKDFKRADELRAELKAKGWLVEDTPSGPKLKKV